MRWLRSARVAITCPLITKSDGTKFGKTEAGNVWLDPEKTSPYSFYQFWLNVSDEDAAKYIKIFTMLGREEIDSLVAEHNKLPHERMLQKKLATEMTRMVHSREDLEASVEASEILFGKGTTETLHRMNENTFLSVFEGVPTFDIKGELLKDKISILDLCSVHTDIFSSKGEMRRLIQGGGLSVNKEKVSDADQLIDDSFQFVDQVRGEKNGGSFIEYFTDDILEKVMAGGNIHARGGIIQDQKLRLGCQGNDQSHFQFHAPGEVFDPEVCVQIESF